MFVPRERQGTGRIDDPASYTVLYAATTRPAAIGASLARYPVWSPVLATVPRLPRAVRAVAALSIEGGAVLDLDQPRTLGDRGMRPSTVVTRDRDVTQAWARAIFAEGSCAGVSWWAELDSRWAIVGIWDLRSARVTNVRPLRMDDPDVVEAARRLGRRIVRERT